MKTVFTYIFMMILLLPSVNAKGLVVNSMNSEYVHSGVHKVHAGNDVKSGCHEKEQQHIQVNSKVNNKLDNHDCCEKEADISTSHLCEHDCKNCADDISSNSFAITSTNDFFEFKLNNKIPNSRYHLPIAPTQSEIIPPIS